MRILIPLILLLSSIQARATFECAHVYGHDSEAQWRQASNDLFRNVMLGNTSKDSNELYFYWHSAFPYNLNKLSPGRYQMVPSGKRMRVYENHSDLTQPNPLAITNTFLGRKGISNQDLLMKFIDNYKARAGDHVIESIIETEQLILSLSDERQSFGYVATGPYSRGGIILGTFRVFNGVPSHTQTPATLPMELSFRQAGMKSRTVDKIEATRRADSNALIYEIGKFSVHADEYQAPRVKEMLELYLLRYYIDSLPDTAMFYVHADSKIHVRHYENRYGLRTVETLTNPLSGKNEYILEASAKELRNAFSKLYPIPHRGVLILPPQ